MSALRTVPYVGRIVFLGVVPPDGGAISVPVERLVLEFGGARGDVRSGRLLPSGGEAANTRQLSILSLEELAETAFAMRIPELRPEWVGASIVLRDMPDLTHLPPSSRLVAPDGATLVVDTESRVDDATSGTIDRFHPGVGGRYKPAARNRCGVTAWVEHPGILEPGQKLELLVPDQRPWGWMAEVLG